MDSPPPSARRRFGPATLAAALALFTLLGLSPNTAAASPPNDDSHIYFMGLDLSTAQSHPGGVLFDPAFVIGNFLPIFDAQLAIGSTSANLLGGGRRAINLVPAGGYHVGWSWGGRRILQLFALARLPIQWRSGANVERRRGVAVSGEVGVRYWRCTTHSSTGSTSLCGGFSLSARYQQNLTDYELTSAVLPRGSAVFSIPFTLTIAIDTNAK